MYKKLIALIIIFATLISLCGCRALVQSETSETDKYVCFTNKKYGRNKRHYLDMCIPKGALGDIGVIMYVHGGGWIGGDKDGYLGTLKENAERGYITAALNYRYANGRGVTCEDILDDIESALKAVKELASEHGLNANKVMLMGGSAGGHLALMYAYSRVETAPIRPVAVVSYAGPTDLTDENFYTTQYVEDIKKMISKVSGVNLLKKSVDECREELLDASPIEYINEASVPTILCHGTIDEVVPYSNSVMLHNRLDLYGVENELITFKDTGHGPIMDEDMSKYADNLFIEYLDRYLK